MNKKNPFFLKLIPNTFELKTISMVENPVSRTASAQHSGLQIRKNPGNKNLLSERKLTSPPSLISYLYSKLSHSYVFLPEILCGIFTVYFSSTYCKKIYIYIYSQQQSHCFEKLKLATSTRYFSVLWYLVNYGPFWIACLHI